MRRIDEKEWRQNSQSHELTYHMASEWRRSGDFMPQTRLLFNAFEFSPNQFSGKTILDLGAGSQLRTLFFEQAHIIALEPLAVAFIKHVDNNNLEKAEALVTTPAEKKIPWLETAVDFCISINVLDHCYNFNEISKNVYFYLKNGGTAFFSFDYHEEADEMHPLTISHKDAVQVFEEIGYTVERSTKGLPDAYYDKYGAYSYGHGDKALNFWLSKPA